MITLHLSALDPQRYQREFSCELPSLEENFDFLNAIVALGHCLLSAYVMEDTIRTDLPVAAFDGLPASIGIQALEQEWRDILNKASVSRSLQRLELIELTRWRIDRHENSMMVHERMIDRYEAWFQRTQAKASVDPYRSDLVQHYQYQLAAHQTQLGKARLFAQLATQRLHQLLA